MKLFSFFGSKEVQEYHKLKQNSYVEMMQTRSHSQITANSILAILISEISRNLSEWIENLINPIINSLLYIVVFGLLLGSFIDNIGGVSYSTYILSGFIIMNVINTSYDEGSYFIMLHKYSKTLQDLQLAPVSVHNIIFATFLASLLRVTFISTTIFICCSLLIGFNPIDNFFMTLAIFLLATFIFTLLGLINGVLSQSWEQLTFALTFIITPLMYISGIFYEISSAPMGLQLISYVNPISYIVDGFRYGMIDVRTLELPFYIHFSFLAITAVLLYFLTCKVFKRKLNIQ
ncbi:hypothetical protein CKF54_03190 [Psittacicella hinzii]|uniref:Transport permease protein n=1 Tax=Psittacicella hinzii TaxID=2028575 RepID=A0A3A1Y7G3_9GAMM|nr:ABC transporter permease [Psittacicella hinzii]RIY33210.1 hypothetical protein CKF54_03190 [Psittacicella hinzii]